VSWSASNRRGWGLAVAGAALSLSLAGCASNSQPQQDPADSDPIKLSDSVVSAPVSPPGALITDPIADLEIEDQVGNGREIVISAITMSRGAGVVVIRDLAGTTLGVADVSPATTPVTIRLDRPVTATQELTATLYADNGNGRFNPNKDLVMVDDEGEPLAEDFDYVVN
jgi:hypothetical protein